MPTQALFCRLRRQPQVLICREGFGSWSMSAVCYDFRYSEDRKAAI
jgi:hypothetical protein